MSRYVNYGAPVIFVKRIARSSAAAPVPKPRIVGVVAEHDGPDGHEQLKPGEQCECGQLGLGIIRDGTGIGNDFDVFFEKFTEIHDEGCESWRP